MITSKIKIDFAPENKKKDFDTPGTFAVYRRKHWWSKWKVVGSIRFADINVARLFARDCPPIYL